MKPEWQNLSNVCDVKEVKTVMRRTDRVYLHSLHWFGNKSTPRGLRFTTHSFGFISSKLRSRLRRRRKKPGFHFNVLCPIFSASLQRGQATAASGAEGALERGLA